MSLSSICFTMGFSSLLSTYSRDLNTLFLGNKDSSKESLCLVVSVVVNSSMKIENTWYLS